MFTMAMSVGHASAHSPHHSFRSGPAVHSHARLHNMSVTPSAEKWPHLVQHRTRRFFSLSSLSKAPVDGFKVQINGRRPPHDTCDVALIYPEAKEESQALSSVSQKSPSSETFENSMVKNFVPLIQLCHGEFLEDHMLYRQKYVIRSYQVGADKATCITTIFSIFQDVSLCHLHFMGIAAREGFGATKAMNRLGLIWVVSKMHVEVESFPKWPDVIEIDCSISRPAKYGTRYDWIVRRCGTNEVLVRAYSNWCTMDSTTRRVCKMPDAVRAELDPFIWDDRYVFQQREHNVTLSSDRIPKLENLTAKYIIPDLKSSRTNLDVNQHVTNSSYISWLLQSVPEEYMETHSLASITIEYRRECQSEDVFESLTSSKNMLEQSAAPVPEEGVANSGLSSSEFTHLLRTQDMAQHEIARARTTWRSKPRLSG